MVLGIFGEEWRRAVTFLLLLFAVLFCSLRWGGYSAAFLWLKLWGNHLHGLFIRPTKMHTPVCYTFKIYLMFGYERIFIYDLFHQNYRIDIFSLQRALR